MIDVYIAEIDAASAENLKIAFKNQDEKWINDKTEKVWENLGYTIAEYSHLKRILKELLVLQHFQKIDQS